MFRLTADLPATAPTGHINHVGADNITTLLLRREDWAVVNVLTARTAAQKFYKEEILGIDQKFRFFPLAELDESIELWPNTPHLRSAKAAWPIPTLAVTNYTFFRRPVEAMKKPKPTLRNLITAYGPICQICGKEFPHKKLTIEHIIPQSLGGKDTWENVLPACAPCNNRKGNRINCTTYKGTQLAATPDAVDRLLRAELHVSPEDRRPEWVEILSKARLAQFGCVTR